ncbi:MAG: hypothetical protein CFH01_00304 [Alphaproteobacteria bacterium MarineAlpha2_Bin1]|nr:MAG: hypothetical protein CFH01_00304 [Alphaproteobacteria bacterium MarineAlpha2_Bin1]|tara:strand:- start:385 stop:1035 length:651 start_codon:yes stop_codon:yes gene_type:complete
MIIKNHNENSREKALNIPTLTLICILSLIGVHALLQVLDEQQKTLLILKLSFIPAIYSNFSSTIFYQIYSPLTYILIHGNLTHLVINICMLAAFGSIIEKEFGRLNFLFIFFSCSLMGIFLHFLIFQNSYSPVIGSSGGICGLFSFYLINKIKQNKSSNLKIIQIFITLILIFYLFSLIDIFPQIDSTKLAWVVHIGGLLGGLIFFYLKKIFLNKN